ncbi:hypothetical protein MNBD_ACTINO02-2757 [hydrothermal vent metagenome]|uniref:Lipoprotein n=1 Tax=hydrothermal vent metagenome TaxID=652676 RepID=A0A3B0RU60_9ZZZZ
MKRFAVLVVFALVVAACGGGAADDAATDPAAALSAEEKAAASEYAVGFKGGFDETAGGMAVTDDQALCVGEKYVGAFGVDRLAEIDNAALDSESIPLDEARQMASLFLDCVPMRDMILENIASSGPEMTEAQTACLSEALTDEALAEVFTAQFSGATTPQDDQPDVFAAMAACANI